MLNNIPHELLQAINDIDQARVKGHNELAKIINEISTQQLKAQQRAQIETIKEIVTHSYKASANYTNLIIVAGYIVFFTVWKSMKADLGKIIMLSSCLSIIISVLLFIISAIHQMVFTALFHRRFFKKLKNELPPSFIDDYRRETQENERNMFRIWIVLFIPTVILGILGSGLLIYAFSESLIHEIIKWIHI
ncbi:MAG: hypothetical protein JW837_05100 [Sedimentisphaerales bacterium]|nr:hypothetical protein [Sedimentisphaerales bacterium]